MSQAELGLFFDQHKDPATLMLDSFDFGHYGPFFPSALAPSLFSEPWACDSLTVVQQLERAPTFEYEVTAKTSLAGMKFANALALTKNVNPADVARFEKMESWHGKRLKTEHSLL